MGICVIYEFWEPNLCEQRFYVLIQVRIYASMQILFFFPREQIPQPQKGKNSPLSCIPPANLPVVSWTSVYYAKLKKQFSSPNVNLSSPCHWFVIRSHGLPSPKPTHHCHFFCPKKNDNGELVSETGRVQHARWSELAGASSQERARRNE